MREIYVKIIFSFSEISNFQHMICILKTFLWLLILTFHIENKTLIDSHTSENYKCLCFRSWVLNYNVLVIIQEYRVTGNTIQNSANKFCIKENKILITEKPVNLPGEGSQAMEIEGNLEEDEEDGHDLAGY